MIKPDENPKPVNLEGEREENQEEVLAAAQPDKRSAWRQWFTHAQGAQAAPSGRHYPDRAGRAGRGLYAAWAGQPSQEDGQADRYSEGRRGTGYDRRKGASVGSGAQRPEHRANPRPRFLSAPFIYIDRRDPGRPLGSAGVRRAIPRRQPPSRLWSTGRPRFRPLPTAHYPYAEQRRLDEYNREREAMEAPTSVKGNLPGTYQRNSSTSIRSAGRHSIRSAECPVDAWRRNRKFTLSRLSLRPVRPEQPSSGRTTSARTIRSKRRPLASNTQNKRRST